MTKLDEQEPKKTIKKKGGNQSEPKSNLRGRDLIYVDTDDDITSIVGKIKASKDGVVALVPPKRIGVLQSVVNLKLLQRAAKLAKKHLVIVTTDSSLVNLASGLAIPIAKNINAQAKIPETTDADDISDVIDGDDVFVAKSNDDLGGAVEDKEISAAVAAIETDDRIRNDRDADGIPDDEQVEPKKPVKKSVKVPSINALRKKILIGGGAAVLVIGFLIWALVFAPFASIVIKAKTSIVEVEKTLSLIPSGDKDAANGLLQPVVKQQKSTDKVEFEATGTKEVGERATGTVALCYDAQPYDSQTSDPNIVSLKAGARLFADGVLFSTDGPVDIKGGQDRSGKCVTYYSVKATAVNIGEESNVENNTQFTVSGQSDLIAVAKGAFTGGSKRTVKVVQQSDVDKAVDELDETGEPDKIKKGLRDQMAETTVVVDSSFTTSRGDVQLSPGIGEEVKEGEKATASIETTYTMIGINKKDLGEIVDAQVAEQVDEDKQKVYDNGLDEVKFSDFQITENGYTVTIMTEAHVGPVIDENEVKKQAKDKKSEEIKALINQIDGVADVNVTMSPFWVTSVGSENKIKVEFEITE